MLFPSRVRKGPQGKTLYNSLDCHPTLGAKGRRPGSVHVPLVGTRGARGLAVELLARTGMRVGELCALEADAVVRIGETHSLRIPVGKLHNDRYIPAPAAARAAGGV